MKKVIICVTVIVMALFPLILSLSSFYTKAYVGPSSFSTYFSSPTSNPSTLLKLNPSYDGIYLLQTTYKSFYGPDTFNSPAKLNSSYFLSGTWNGQDINELDSKYLYDIDVSGFSQAFSYSDEGGYFVYSMITCLPVKGGDNFTIFSKFNSVNVRESSYYSIYSYIPGGSGCKMVHFEYGTEHPDNSLSYTVKSSNHHLAVVLNPDDFSQSSSCGLIRSQSCNCTSFSGLTSIGYNAKCTDFFSTSFNYPAGSDISVTLKDSVNNYSFSVYEIFTDGTLTPGFNTEGEQSTTETTPGSSGEVSVDLSGVLAKLDEIRQAINNKVVEVTVNVSSAVQEKLDVILDTLVNLPADMWDSFKVGLSDMFRITEDAPEPELPPSESEPPPSTSESESYEEPVETTTTGISLEIDSESFEKVIQEVNVDNLGVNIVGEKGALAFFWYITDKFLDSTSLYTAAFISLFLAFCAWLLRS